MSDTSTLTSLGSNSRRDAAKQTEPRPDFLEAFKNPKPDRLYVVPFIQTRDEFTSLCPKTGQPDHARLEIVYVPRDKMIESKSLKEYLVTFRNHGEFHEDCINRIAGNLFDLIDPYYLRVYGDFAPRGGLAITPLVELWTSNIESYIEKSILRLVQAFDTKK